MLRFRTSREIKPGSAYETWYQAGVKWATVSLARSEGAKLIAATCYASDRGYTDGNARRTCVQAFLEGADTINQHEDNMT